MEATVFAGVHCVFIFACVRLWAIESRRRAAEMYALDRAKRLGFQADSTAEIDQLGILAASLAEKDRLIDASLINQRLTRSISPSDVAFRACVNGFVITGLLGTLYNLWHLGPDFWKALLQPSYGVSHAPINVAFAASIFGLGWALAFGLVDSFVMQPRREHFVKEAMGFVLSTATAYLPQSVGPMLSQSVRELKEAAISLFEQGTQAQTQLTQNLVEGAFGHSDVSRSRCWYRRNTWSSVPLYLAQRSANM